MHLSVEMVSSITLDPYSIIKPLTEAWFTILKIGLPPRLTELHVGGGRCLFRQGDRGWTPMHTMCAASGYPYTSMCRDVFPVRPGLISNFRMRSARTRLSRVSLLPLGIGLGEVKLTAYAEACALKCGAFSSTCTCIRILYMYILVRTTHV